MTMGMTSGMSMQQQQQRARALGLTSSVGGMQMGRGQMQLGRGQMQMQMGRGREAGQMQMQMGRGSSGAQMQMGLGRGRGGGMQMQMGNQQMQTGNQMQMGNQIQMGRGRGGGMQMQMGNRQMQMGNQMQMGRGRGGGMQMQMGNRQMQMGRSMSMQQQQQMMVMQQRQQQHLQQQRQQQAGNKNNGNDPLNLLGRMKGGSALEMDEDSRLAPGCVFRTVPRGGDLSGIRCLLEATRHALTVSLELEHKEQCRMAGQPYVADGSRRDLTEMRTKHVSLLVRLVVCKMVQADLQVLRPDTSVRLPRQHRSLVKLCTRQLAHAASKQAARANLNSTGNGDPSDITSAKQLFDIKRTIMAIESLEKNIEQKQEKAAVEKGVNTSSGVPPELRLSSTAASSSSVKQPLFGRLRADRDVESLAGGARRPPIFRPVEMTLVPDRVESFHDVAVCLHQCAKICTRLANQSHLVKNSFCLRAALIQHVFTRVIPLPLPVTHPRRGAACFWHGAARPMRYETQADLLRSLHIVAQHFSCASLSLRLTRSFDAVRILTMAALSTIADAVLRVVACDVPSELSAHYSGKAEGPMCTPFGVEMRMFAAESSNFLLTDPALVLVRTQVLDYFTEQRKTITAPDSHLLFRWERTMEMGDAEALFMKQVCVAVGFPAPGVDGEPLDLAGAYLCGGDRSTNNSGKCQEMFREFPELAYFRDIIFILKTFMTPTSDALPEIRAWSPMDAVLSWKFAPGAPLSARKEAQIDSTHDGYKPGTFKVAAFNRELKCVWQVDTLDKKAEAEESGVESKQEAASWYKRLGGFVKDLFFTSASPRAPPSMADPSFLLGQKVKSEDDVLHVRELPDFGGRINARACELLLQYLTAPYLRIPLVLRFFSAPEMTTALADEQLQGMLDAVLFEPGSWQPDEEITCPEQVPAPNRKHLATPLGLLFNELQKSPDSVLVAVGKLLTNVLELDAGRFDATSTPAILYVVRLTVRIQGFVHMLLRHAEFVGNIDARSNAAAMGMSSKNAAGAGSGAANPFADDGEVEDAPGMAHTTGIGGATYVRGLECSTELAKKLGVFARRWRYDILHRVFPMLLTWARRAVNQGAVGALCVIRAHLAYLFRNAAVSNPVKTGGGNDPAEDGSVSEQLAVRTVLCSQVFLTASYRFDVEPRANEVAARFGGARRKPKAAPKTKKKKKKNIRNKRRGSRTEAEMKKSSVAAQKKKGNSLFQNDYATNGSDLDDTELLVNDSLGIPQMELFSLFQVKRGEVLSWLQRNPHACNRIMEECVRVVTNKTKSGTTAIQDMVRPDGAAELRRTRSASLEARTWHSLQATCCGGRFVPDTEAVARAKQQASIDAAGEKTGKGALRYEDWLRQTTNLGVDTEINVQLGEFTLKKHRVEPVDERMCMFSDFRQVFGTDKKGASHATTGFQCAEVRNTSNRLWVRMVGRRHDLQLWSRPRNLDPAAGCWPSRGPFNRLFPSQISSSSEKWILDAMRPHVADIPAEQRRTIQIFLHDRVHSSGAIMARLAIVTYDSDGVGQDGDTSGALVVALRELILIRYPRPTMHVFDVLEHGRRFYRSLVWTSDRHRTLSELPFQPSLSSILLSPMRAAPTLVITRSLTAAMGTQMHVPAKFLRGLVPEALLWQYKFWQQHEEGGRRIIGYRTPPQAENKRDDSNRFSQIRITLFHEDPNDKAGQCKTESVAIVERLQLVPPVNRSGGDGGTDSKAEEGSKVPDASTAVLRPRKDSVSTLMRSGGSGGAALIGLGHDDVIDTSEDVLTLLDLLHGPGANTVSPLRALCELMLRLDSLPWCLCWTKQRVAGTDPTGTVSEATEAERKAAARHGFSIDLVELPRLGLSFCAEEEEIIDRGVSSGGSVERMTKVTRLYSVDHDGLFVSNEATTDESTQQLLRGLPHAVVLERNTDGSLFILLPAGAKPEVTWDLGSGGLASCNLELDRTDSEWLNNLGDARHYLYPVHLSRCFLFTPTLASGMYLLLLRWIDGQYGEVFQLADFCVTDTPLKPDEEQIFAQLIEIGGADPHSDAVACRVKMILVFSGTPMATLREEMGGDQWDPTTQMQAYLSRISHVSGRCRLSRAEEMLLLDLCQVSLGIL